MKNWYAFICTKDKKDYKSGEVCSFSTEDLTESELISRGIRSVLLGQFNESGPNFRTHYFDMQTEKLLPITE